MGCGGAITSGVLDRGIQAEPGEVSGVRIAADGRAGGRMREYWDVRLATKGEMVAGKCVSMATLGSLGMSGTGVSLGGGRRGSEGPGPSARAAVGAGVRTGTTAVEEDPACLGGRVP